MTWLLACMPVFYAHWYILNSGRRSGDGRSQPASYDGQIWSRSACCGAASSPSSLPSPLCSLGRATKAGMGVTGHGLMLCVSRYPFPFLIGTADSYTPGILPNVCKAAPNGLQVHTTGICELQTQIHQRMVNYPADVRFIWRCAINDTTRH